MQKIDKLIDAKLAIPQSITNIFLVAISTDPGAKWLPKRRPKLL